LIGSPSQPQGYGDNSAGYPNPAMAPRPAYGYGGAAPMPGYGYGYPQPMPANAQPRPQGGNEEGASSYGAYRGGGGSGAQRSDRGYKPY
jgi:hypothetical protein